MQHFASKLASYVVAFAFARALVACASPSPAARVESTPPEQASTAERAADADALFAQGRWDEAVDAFRARVAADADDAVAWHRLGYALHALKRYDEAIEANERAAAFPAQRPASLYNIACARALKGERDAALGALERAVAAGFKDAATIAGDSDLELLRGDRRFVEIVGTISAEAVGRHRELDFWLGDWDVFDPTGQRLGGNAITRGERGFVIQESWTSAAGQTGRSLNFVDPQDGRWKQLWIDDSGNVIRFDGEFRDGAMRFEGPTWNASGQQGRMRCTFTPNADGSVRQRIESRNAAGEWVVVFDGRYLRKTS